MMKNLYIQNSRVLSVMDWLNKENPQEKCGNKPFQGGRFYEYAK